MAAQEVLDALVRLLEAVVHAHGGAQARDIPALSPIAAAVVAAPERLVLLHDVEVAAVHPHRIEAQLRDAGGVLGRHLRCQQAVGKRLVQPPRHRLDGVARQVIGAVEPQPVAAVLAQPHFGGVARHGHNLALPKRKLAAPPRVRRALVVNAAVVALLPAVVVPQRIARRRAVVQHDVYDHRQAMGVRRIHEHAHVVRRAVRRVQRQQLHRVVAPLVGVLAQRHQLHRRHAQRRNVLQLGNS